MKFEETKLEKTKRKDIDKIIGERLTFFERRKLEREERREERRKVKSVEIGADKVIETRTQTFVSRKGVANKPDLEDSAGVCVDESKQVRLKISEDGTFEEAYVNDTKLIL